MTQDNGASSPCEDRATAAEPVIPSAGRLPNITYLSCILCHGARVTEWGPCESCADPDPVRVRWMLERLSEGQIDFLRAFGHTLAYQPITEAENDAHRCEYFVEDGDGVFTRHWFASGIHKSGPNGWASFIRYNPTGLMLRECLRPTPKALAMDKLTPLTPEEIAEWTALEKAATPGEWEWLWCDEFNAWRLSPGVLVSQLRDGTPGGDAIDRANAAFIAAARTAVPALLAHIAMMEAGIMAERGALLARMAAADHILAEGYDEAATAPAGWRIKILGRTVESARAALRSLT